MPACIDVGICPRLEHRLLHIAQCLPARVIECVAAISRSPVVLKDLLRYIANDEDGAFAKEELVSNELEPSLHEKNLERREFTRLQKVVMHV